MIYCVFEYGGTDRVVVCDDEHQASVLLDQVENVKREPCFSLGFLDDDDMKIYLYPDTDRIDLTDRIEKAAKDYIQEKTYGHG